MKILIIGSGGQLGSDCTTVLSPHHEVRGCDFPEIDITSRDSVASLIENNQPEVIINCAAYTAVDKCETETDLAWKVNADGPEYLAQATSAIGARLVHISTDYVFDGNKDIPGSYLESDSPNPLSEYGRSKLAGEEAVNRYAQDYVILRTAWLYSATGPNFLKTMLRLAVSSPEKELKVVNDQYGSLTWSYPLAQQIEQLLDSRIQG
ncbi:MAG: dTDP-4-dehydrorhamnose reductase, partial [Desulfobacterales bacterium]